MHSCTNCYYLRFDDDDGMFTEKVNWCNKKGSGHYLQLVLDDADDSFDGVFLCNYCDHWKLSIKEYLKEIGATVGVKNA